MVFDSRTMSRGIWVIPQAPPPAAPAPAPAAAAAAAAAAAVAFDTADGAAGDAATDAAVAVAATGMHVAANDDIGKKFEWLPGTKGCLVLSRLFYVSDIVLRLSLFGWIPRCDSTSESNHLHH